MENEIDKLALELAKGLTLEDLRARQNAARKSNAETSQEAAAALQAYWNKVYSTTRREAKNKRSYGQIMAYSEARKIVADLLNFRADEIEGISGAPFAWDIPKDSELAATIRGLIQYFINDPECPWPLNKGLLVYGLPGAGKTEMMRIMMSFCLMVDSPKKFSWSSMTNVYTLARTDKTYDFMQAATFDRCLDEFLRHTGNVNYFGDQVDINEHLIETRYTRNRTYGQLTHFITNGDTNTVQELLSAPAFDRVRGMCTGVLFPGGSKR